MWEINGGAGQLARAWGLGQVANAAHDQFLPSPGPPPSERLLPLFVEGTLKGDVFLHGGVQQPRFLRSIGHGTSLPGKSREGGGRHSQGFVLRGSCQDNGLDQGKGWHSVKTGVGVGGCVQLAEISSVWPLVDSPSSGLSQAWVPGLS